MPTVTIYSTPLCPYCKAVKEYFKENSVNYSDINVADDKKAAEEMIDKSGQMGVPVVVIEKGGKEELIIGFDKPKIAQLLDLND